MRTYDACLVAAALSRLLAAQSVSVSLQSLSWISISRTEGGVVTQAQLPAGPLGQWGAITMGPFHFGECVGVVE